MLKMIRALGAVLELVFVIAGPAKAQTVPAPPFDTIAPYSGAVRRPLREKLGESASLSDFGGVASEQTATCNVTASSTTLTCSGGVADFKVGQGVLIFGAGAAITYGAPTGLTVTACGKSGGTLSWCTTGSATACYSVASVDAKGAIGAPVAEVCTTSSPGTINALNPNYLSWTAPSPAPQSYVILHNRGAGRVPIGVTAITSFSDYGVDNAFAQNTLPAQDWLPSADITAARPGWLRTTIASVSGSTITLASAAGTTVGAATVRHENTAALVAALAASRNVAIPCSASPYLFSGEYMGITTAGQNIRGGGAGCSKLKIAGAILNRSFLRASAARVTFRDFAVDVDNKLQARSSAISAFTADNFWSNADVLNHTMFGYSIDGGENVILTDALISLNFPTLSQNQAVNVSSITSTARKHQYVRLRMIGSGFWGEPQDSIVDAPYVSGARFGTQVGFGGSSSTKNKNNILRTPIIDCGHTQRYVDVNATEVSGSEIWGTGHQIIGGNYTGCSLAGIKIGASRSKILGVRLADNDYSGVKIYCPTQTSATACANDLWIDGVTTEYTAGATLTQSYGLDHSYTAVTGLRLGANNIWSGATAPILYATVNPRSKPALSADVAATTATMADVTDLWKNVVPGVYEITIDAQIDADATGGWQLGIAFNSGVTGSVLGSFTALCNTTGTGIKASRLTSLTGLFGENSSGCTSVNVKGTGRLTVSTTAGPATVGAFTLRFAQQSASGTSTLKAGSVFKLLPAQP